MEILNCYVPFYRLQIKKHHALDKHLLPLRVAWEICFEGICTCVFCACATILSEIQSCDVPLIYTKYSNRVPLLIPLLSLQNYVLLRLTQELL